MLAIKENISKGDVIKSLRDNRIYKVIGYSQEYHIVTGNTDNKLHAVKKCDAILLKG